jgi:hypothetical protein
MVPLVGFYSTNERLESSLKGNCFLSVAPERLSEGRELFDVGFSIAGVLDQPLQ